MPTQRDRSRTPVGNSPDILASALSDRVRSEVNGNGHNGNGHNGNGHNGNGHNGTANGEHARGVAVEVAAAMLAKANAGTAEHSEDVVLIAEAIAQRMGIGGRDADDLFAAARLHDIGKASIPPDILEKTGPLSDDEWELMRQHTLVGERILSSVAELAGVARLVRHSHERWDGGGYPDGLGGAEIPLGSRIIFCADSFHAIRSDRPYRPGRSASEALQEVERCAGTQFDPDVVRELVEVVRERRRRPRGTGRSARLFALFMCLVVGGAGTAIARSGLLGEDQPPQGASAPQPPPACGTAACPSAAVPVGGLGAVGEPGSTPGPRPLDPGLPGTLHSDNAGPGPVRDGAQGRSSSADPGEGKGPDESSKANPGKSAAAKTRHQASGHGNASHHGAPHPTGSHNGGAQQGSAATSGSSASHGSSNGHHSGSGGNGSSGHGSAGHGSSVTNGSSGGGGSTSGQTTSGSTGSDASVDSSPGNSGNAPGHNK